LVMLLTGKTSIKEVIIFPMEKRENMQSTQLQKGKDVKDAKKN